MESKPDDLTDLLASLEPDPAPLELTFRWEDLPRQEVYFTGYSSLLTERSATHLPDGRAVRLTVLHQYLVYEGVLAGLPDGLASHVEHVGDAVLAAAMTYGVEQRAVHVLPPKLIVATVRGADEKERRVEFLPPVVSYARLESPVPTGDGDGSTLVLVWFQRYFGLPPPNVLREAVKGTPWAERAEDWSW